MLTPSELPGLLDRARHGDAAAQERLFILYRDELHRAVGLRLDRRLAARIDVSDVVQETWLEAVRRLKKDPEAPALPFGLWLRCLAHDQIHTAHRVHLGADKRSVRREVPELPVASSACFVRGLLGREPSPSQAMAAAEDAELLREALGQLDDGERDLILWRHFEQLSNRDVAALVGVTEAAASKRYVRALERLGGLLRNLGLSGT
jgi:RNA polymerase sigma-70 factor (ECF subfamily)